MSFVFNRIVIRPQLPNRIKMLYDISYNLWWTWNTDFLKLFKEIDIDLWERCKKNAVKFLKLVDQEKLERAANNEEFLRMYDKVVNDYNDYMNSKDTWFAKNYPNNKDDLIAYFSAEYGMDETIPTYSGGLGILSGDHVKAASDLGIPFVAVGLLYKEGYFTQLINGYGQQETSYSMLDIDSMPFRSLKKEDGSDFLIELKMPTSKLYLKVWDIKVGRVTLYLMDSDIEENPAELRDTTCKLYGGNQDMRIRQEIVLGIAGVKLLDELGIKPRMYHLNEGHSSFLILEKIRQVMAEKEVSFNIAREIVSSQVAFTTHTPIAIGNDIFPIDLVKKYFHGYWEGLGITEDEFLRLGMKPHDDYNSGFNMGVLALKVAGKKNGVSKLHGEVSRELFSDVWPEVPKQESPITYVTNGVHTCSWLSPNLKKLYNNYLTPYWQDNIQDEKTWENIYTIPNEELYREHRNRKIKLLSIVKNITTERLRRCNYSYDDIEDIVGGLNPDALTIGFARRFATYKRATLIFKDLERITQIFNEKDKPVQIIFAGKAHPVDKEGQDLIQFIHEIAMKPQFKGKVFLLENYNIGIARYLVSGVDIWLNNPRRPLEASGTSGQKAALNGAVNFSVSDGWWVEGYNQKNGFVIGTDDKYQNYEEQDQADANSIYNTLERKIIPIYYEKNGKEYSDKWVEIMKNSIASNSGRFSTARMVEDYVERIYIPLCNLNKAHYEDLNQVAQFDEWKKRINENFDKIKITQDKDNLNDIIVDAGNKIVVGCSIKLPEELIDINSIQPQVYVGKISNNGVVDDIEITDMKMTSSDDGTYHFEAEISMKNGGDYGYTFRVIPKNEMLLEPMDLNQIKWIN